MIKNIIFDFGNVFLPLKPGRLRFEFMKLGLFYAPQELKEVFAVYEVGKVDADDFVSTIQKYTPLGNSRKIRKAWFSVLGDFDESSLEFLSWAKSHHRVFLLSNMNVLHMEFLQNQMGIVYKIFEDHFDRLYFSHLVGIQKPHRAIYEMVLKENQLLPHESIFIDDLSKNIAGASQFGIHTWRFDIRKTSLSNLKGEIERINLLDRSI